jgi:hypothetical protein
MTPYIYIITNTINNKQYLGQHDGQNPNYMGSGKLLRQAIKKYGIENFTKEIIEYCTKEQLNAREIFWGEYHDVVNNNNFYNIVSCGTGGYNEKAVEANRKKRGKTWEEICSIEGLARMKNRDRTNAFDFRTIPKEQRVENAKKANKARQETNYRHTAATIEKIRKGNQEKTISKDQKDQIATTVSNLWEDPESVYNTTEYRNKLKTAQQKRHAENPKVDIILLQTSLDHNPDSFSAALRYYNSLANKTISRPTFDKWRKLL